MEMMQTTAPTNVHTDHGDNSDDLEESEDADDLGGSWGIIWTLSNFVFKCNVIDWFMNVDLMMLVEYCMRLP